MSSMGQPVSTESIESIARPPSAATGAAPCAACGAPLAEDQRYCLQCGERATPISSVLAGPPPAPAPGAGTHLNGPVSPSSALAPPGAAPPSLPGVPDGGEAPGRGNAVTVIAGVGVLLLAMGIGVLIGRSGAAKPSGSAAAQVITVSTSPTAATSASESFAGDWPAGSGGYTVQLQSLPTAGTQVSAVQAAKSAAEGKGATAVGALKSDEFAGLPAGEYIVYSGKYSKRAEAEKALGALKKSFPGASVLHLGASGRAAGGNGTTGKGRSGGGKSGVGSSPGDPAPPAVVESLRGKSGKSYEQESKNLPNVVSTG
jgi:hypothetical protein